MLAIQVTNNGQEIAETNYWESEFISRGFVYISINAGCYRLLLPNDKWLADLKTAKEVVISRGKNGGRDSLEVMFDDHTKNPFVLQTSLEQWDRLPSSDDIGWKGACHVYTKKGKVLSFDKVFFRIVNVLPCMKAAGK